MELENKFNLIVLLVSIIITSLIVGGSVYAWQQKKISKIEDTLAQKEEMPEQTNDKDEGEEKVLEQTGQMVDAAKIITLFDSSTSTAVFEDTYKTISLKYPDAIFNQYLTSDETSLRVSVSSLENWKQTKGREVDGVCDDKLGDPDCGVEFNWPEQKKLFEEAVSQEKVFLKGHETFPIMQDTKEIGENIWLRQIKVSLHGEATVQYIYYSDDSAVTISASIHEDIKYSGGEPNMKDEALIQAAKNIFEGKEVTLSSQVKLLAIEKLIDRLEFLPS